MIPKKRLHEIDLLRGIGVIFMVVYHFFFDLNYFGLLSLHLQNFPWSFLALSAQLIFILAAGLTFTLSFPSALPTSKIFFTKRYYLLKLATLALLISLITWLLFGENFVKFGILHFYVLATILTIPLHQLKFCYWRRKHLRQYAIRFSFRQWPPKIVFLSQPNDFVYGFL